MQNLVLLVVYCLSQQITNEQQQVHIDNKQIDQPDPEPEKLIQETQNQKLLLSKQQSQKKIFSHTFTFTNRNSQHYNTIIEDENDEGVWEENYKEVNPSKPFLMSINSFNISFIRKKFNLIRELTIRYPQLLLLYLQIGIGVGKLNNRNLEERKRLLQNVINKLTMNQELILSSSFRNFFEEGNQEEFENKRKQGQFNMKGDLAQNLQTVRQKYKIYLAIEENWRNGTRQNKKCEELEQISLDYKNYQINKPNIRNYSPKFKHYKKTQQKIKDIIAKQDSQKTQQLIEKKLHDCIFDNAKNLDLQTNTLEDKFEINILIYIQNQLKCISVSIINMVINECNCIIDYTDIYYKQLIKQIEDLNEQLTYVAPNQQTHQTIKDVINKYLRKAKDQFCNKKDGIISKYIGIQQKGFTDYYISQQSEI